MAGHDQVDIGGVVALALLVLMAITQPGGAGTTIFLYDDANNTNHAAAPGPHTFAEIAAAFPADFTALGTNEPSYRGLVSVQIGDAGVGTATTTLQDTNKTVIWDATRTLTNRATQLTSWFLNLGTKVGVGNQASGKDGCTLVFGAATALNENLALYGCTFKTRTGALTFGSVLGPTREMINCIIQSSVAGVAPIILGGTNIPITNIYNCDFSHATTSQLMAQFIATSAERITISGTTPTVLLQVGAPNLVAKDLALFGNPATSDFRWQALGAILWTLIRPVYTGNAPKFSTASSGNPSLASGPTIEYWAYDVKVVDRNGLGVANIPVKLTDVVGNVQVDTVTDVNGQIDFGTGATANFVAVMDHYAVGTVYTQRHRSPFYCQVNTGIGTNTNYQQRTFYFLWPGYESVTTSSGSFYDMSDVIPIEDQSSGAATTWIELSL